MLPSLPVSPEMTRLRGMDSIDGETARFVRRAGQDFKTQTHAAPLHAKNARNWQREFSLTPDVLALRDGLKMRSQLLPELEIDMLKTSIASCRHLRARNHLLNFFCFIPTVLMMVSFSARI